MSDEIVILELKKLIRRYVINVQDNEGVTYISEMSEGDQIKLNQILEEVE